MLNRAMSVSLGALLSIGMRWTDRLIGLASTLILARLLAPSDLGIIAMASLVIGMIDVFLDLGVNIVLIQNRNATAQHYNAAWTLRIIQSSLAAIAIYIVAEPAALYFQEPHVVNVLHVLAISPLLAGCENIGIVTFQKNMQFGLEFRFFFIKRVAGFIATIIAAWFLRDFWALVIGTIASRTAGLILSYIVHPMRLRLTFTGIREILSFSTWILLRGIGNYFHNEAHKLIVGHRESTFVMGAYSLGGEISAMPTTELLAPLSRVLFPAFVRVKDDVEELKRTYLLALGVQTLVGIPAGVGMVLVAEELVLALLGEKWISAVPYIQVFGIFNILGAINYSGGYLLLALNKAKVSAAFVWAQVVLFLSMAEFVFPHGNALTIAQIRLGVGVLGFIPYGIYISYLMPTIKIGDRLAYIWRSIIAAGLMISVLYEFPLLVGVPVMAILLLKVLVGAFVYIASTIGLWLLVSRPDGAESYLLGKLTDFRKSSASV